MSLPVKMTTFSFNHADQPDDLGKNMSSDQIKAAFDSRATEVLAYVNAMHDALTQEAAQVWKLQLRRLMGVKFNG